MLGHENSNQENCFGAARIKPNHEILAWGRGKLNYHHNYDHKYNLIVGPMPTESHGTRWQVSEFRYTRIACHMAKSLTSNRAHADHKMTDLYALK